MNRCATAVSTGDLEAARAFGEEAISVAHDLGSQLARSFPGFTLAQALAEAGEPERACALMLESAAAPTCRGCPTRGGPAGSSCWRAAACRAPPSAAPPTPRRPASASPPRIEGARLATT